MATRTQTVKATPVLGRVPYRFTAEQVLRMVEQGLFEDEDVELWDGVLYKMVKGELHNFIVAQVADALRRATPSGFHVREEKSSSFAADSLPEPDVAICRGGRSEYLPHPPALSRMTLVVEVNHHTSKADAVVKYRRYAAVGIPVYWVVDAEARTVRVHTAPRGGLDDADFASVRSFAFGDEIPVEVDGVEVGRVPVAEFFPDRAG